MPEPIPAIPTPEPEDKEPKAGKLILASAGCLAIFALIAFLAFGVWRLMGL